MRLHLYSELFVIAVKMNKFSLDEAQLVVFLFGCALKSRSTAMDC